VVVVDGETMWSFNGRAPAAVGLMAAGASYLGFRHQG
jgi:hypothetical protein